MNLQITKTEEKKKKNVQTRYNKEISEIEKIMLDAIEYLKTSKNPNP